MKAHDKFRATWSKKENDVILHFPLGFGTKSDGHWLSGVFDDAFVQELTKRGYDITTMKFSIEPQKGNPKFASERPDEMTTEEAWKALLATKQ